MGTAQRSGTLELLTQARKALQQGDPEGALQALQGVLSQNPDDTAALSLLADVFERRGDKQSAIASMIAALKADSGDVRNMKKFLALAGDVACQSYVPDLEYAIFLCLETPDVEFEFASILWTSVLFQMPFFRLLYGQVFMRVMLRKFLPFLKNPFNGIKDLRPLLYPYFLLGIRKNLVYSLQFEQFMVLLRAFLLEQADAAKPRLSREDYLKLVISVAYYAYRADYILDVTDTEARTIEALRTAIEAQSGSYDAAQVALLACYMPLHRLKNAEAIAQQLGAIPDMTGLIEEQINEALMLRRRIPSIPKLTPIDDAISEKVREQYEIFPYPRWRGLGETPRTWAEQQKACLTRPNASVLIAGCGTGMQSCRVAMDYPNAEIVAVDISAASLAYAIDRSERYGFKNITYAQADINNLAALNRQFDYIECFGVLMTMKDPEKGWEVLARLLKPGGVMYIGLYSQLAHRAIMEARAVIAKGSYPSTPEGMRRFRKDSPRLLRKEVMAVLTENVDYYALNNYRDLLFPAHDDRFTIPRIKAAIEKLGLVFEGMLTEVGDSYRQMFPNDAKPNLDNWDAFEHAYPDTFRTCYAFLCRKPG